MKRIFYPGLLVALLFLFSCEKDTFTEKDAGQSLKNLISYQDSLDQVRDSLNYIGGVINYSVSVVPVDGSASFVDGHKSGQAFQSLAGALVTVSQNGVTLSDSTNESGIVVFPDMRIGKINVNVRADNYTRVSFVAELNPETDGSVLDYYNVLRNVATMIPVFSLTEKTSTIEGLVTYESDLTNRGTENTAGATVTAIVDVDDEDFSNNYFKLRDGTSDYYGTIVQAAYLDLVGSATTDASGNYSITMPSAADGLPVKLEVSDIIANQSLIMTTMNGVDVFGTQSVRTLFNSEYAAASAVPTDYESAYLTFSTPDGNVAEPADVAATATAVVSKSGIASISISNVGEGYTQAPIIKITNTGIGYGAKATAAITDGKVSSVTITEAGAGYTDGTATFIDKEGVNAKAEVIATYSLNTLALSAGGSGYSAVPAVEIVSGSGTGATAEAVMASLIIKTTVTAEGTGYVCPPNVLVSGNAVNQAKYTVTMSQSNPIHSIIKTGDFAGLYYPQTTTPPDVEITGSSEGSGATATVTIANIGEIVPASLVLTNTGSGYEQAPTVHITNGGGFGATAYATVAGGSITNIVITDLGENFTGNPTITIGAPTGAGGIQAVATIEVHFPIGNITLTNGGTGYDFYATAPGTYVGKPNITLVDPVTAAFIANITAQVELLPNMKVDQLTLTPGTGTGYTTDPTITFEPACGEGSGAAATVETTQYVRALNLLTEGSGYRFGDVKVNIITPSSGCSAQAKATATLADGVIASVTAIEKGTKYTAAPYVTIKNGATTLTSVKVAAVLTGESVTSYTVVDGGMDVPYVASSNLTASISTKITAATAALGVHPESGKLEEINITGAGEGYSVTPIVNITRNNGVVGPGNENIGSSSFVDAVATAEMVDGRVVGITITNAGTGYYNDPIITISVPNRLETASAKVLVNAKGYITGVDDLIGGMGYATAPTLTFNATVTGMGAGATAFAVISGGVVTSVVITNGGAGYVGENYPAAKAPSGADAFKLYAGKTYIKDIYLGTGVRTIVD